MFSGVHFCVGLQDKYFILGPSEIRWKIFLLIIALFFFFLFVGGGIIVQNALLLDAHLVFFPYKVGKLAPFYFISYQALPFLTTRYKEEGQRMRPGVKRSVASTPLRVSFQNK